MTNDSKIQGEDTFAVCDACGGEVYCFECGKTLLKSDVLEWEKTHSADKCVFKKCVECALKYPDEEESDDEFVEKLFEGTINEAHAMRYDGETIL